MTSREDWAKVDHYITEALEISDTDMKNIQERSAAAGLPSIEVAPNQGKLLQLFVQMSGAHNILEIGTLGGYSTVWLAKALPVDGKLITLEADPRHAEIARANFQSAGYDHLIELREGPALENLPRLEGETFDLIFLDADKEETPDYFSWALRLSRQGTVIICDNVVRRGKVAEEDLTNPGITGIRRFFEQVEKEPRVNATAVQTVGEKGHDGMAVLVVTEDVSS